jgi:hypothetical protein
MTEINTLDRQAPWEPAAGRRERLGLDCDGVLSNFAVYTLARINRDMGLTLRVNDWRPIVEDSAIARQVGAAVFRMMEEDALWAGLPPYPATARRIAALRERYDIYVVTAISDRFAAVRGEWLARYGVVHEGLICVPQAEDKVQVARDLDLVAFVDDLAPVAALLAESGVDSYLVRRPWNADIAVNGGVKRGRWDQILSWLLKRPAR